MASSGNFCTYNPLPYSTYFRVALYTNTYNSVKNAGNTLATPGNACTGFGTMALTSGKKWYMEGIATNAYTTAMGIFEVNDCNAIQGSLNTTYHTNTSYKSAFYAANGKKYIDGTESSYGATFVAGDIIGMAVDLESDTNTVTFYKNNSSQGSFNLGANGLDYLFMLARPVSSGGFHMNWGQDSTFAGTKTAGGNADDNGFGDFFYAVPSGHLALCSGNLGVDSGIDPAQTNDDHPVKLFGLLSYTGNGGANSVTGLGFKPDLVWGLNRSASQSKRVLDSSRGGNNYVYLDQNAAQVTGAQSGDTVEFLDDGIKWNNTNGNNDNTVTYVAACWRANGGTTASNTSGTITTTVQTDPPQSFSIVKYTGTGSNATIGHGLSAAPDCVWIKNLSQNDSWIVYNSGPLLGNSKFIRVDLNLGSNVTGTSYMQDTSPSSTVVSLGNSHNVNASTEEYIAYCWRNSEGFQRFGTFDGNGNDDGPFVYTGFRPQVVLIAPLTFSGTPHWGFHNSVSNNNGSSLGTLIDLDDTYAEYTSTGRRLEMLSNGFKARTSDAAMNSTSGLAYFCWGDVPFKYNNTF